jgi:hypothetical protein
LCTDAFHERHAENTKQIIVQDEVFNHCTMQGIVADHVIKDARMRLHWLYSFTFHKVSIGCRQIKHHSVCGTLNALLQEDVYTKYVSCVACIQMHFGTYIVGGEPDAVLHDGVYREYVSSVTYILTHFCTYIVRGGPATAPQ